VENATTKKREVENMTTKDTNAFADFFPVRRVRRPRPVSAKAQKLMDRMTAIGGSMDRSGHGWEIFYRGVTSEAENLWLAEQDVEMAEDLHRN